MIYVLKASGEKEVFSEEKVVDSIRRAGIPKVMQDKVLEHVKSKLYNEIPSGEIYHHVTEFLEQSTHPFTKSKYSLKQAIMDLGPTGYPFEDYLAKLLEAQGYHTKTRQLIRGKCITHEVDVVAEKNTVLQNKIMVEAKFHNEVGLRTDIHVALYTKARFDDIKDTHGFTEVWLATNTKASLDAITYANCVRMNLLSWSYPENSSLRDLIEQYKLYPITVLTTLTQEQKQKLLRESTVLVKDLSADHSKLTILDLSQSAKELVLKEVDFVSHQG